MINICYYHLLLSIVYHWLGYIIENDQFLVKTNTMLGFSTNNLHPGNLTENLIKPENWSWFTKTLILR